MTDSLHTTLAGVEQLQADALTGTFEERCAAAQQLEVLQRRVDLAKIRVIGVFMREGEFSSRGYKRPVNAVRDLLTITGHDAYRYVKAVENIGPRTTLDGTVL
ncbi:hypothetical protein WEH80_03030, partial [Actinomycetes bacterium KLBMP 9759]